MIDETQETVVDAQEVQMDQAASEQTATEAAADLGLPEFDYGDGFAGTEAKEAGDFPVLPRSKRTTKRVGETKVSDYNPKYLVELARPASVVTPNFPGATPRLKMQFRSVNFIPGTKAHGTVFFEVPLRDKVTGLGGFRTPEGIAADIDADIVAQAKYTLKPGFDRVTAIQNRGGFQQRQKATLESLEAVLGGQKAGILTNSGFVGAKFAIAVNTREQNDGQVIAEAVKFFPAAAATDTNG